MADRTYVPGYGYVTKGESGTGETSRPGWKPPVSWGSGGSGSSDGSQRGAASDGGSVPADKPTNSSNLSNPPDVQTGTYYNSQTLGVYGPPGGLSSPLAQGYGYGTGTSLRELPKIFSIRTIGDAKDAYWNDPASRALIEQAAATHYSDYSNYSPQWAEGFWNDIVQASLAPGAQSPWETIEGILSGRMAGQGSSASTTTSGGSGSYSYSSGGGGYSSGGGGQVRLTDPTSARGLLLQTMQGVLGRNPTEREYRDFLKTLNESEMANPQTVSVEGDNAVYSGGIDAGVLAADFAKSADDYKETQANKFYNAFMGALAGGA